MSQKCKMIGMKLEDGYDYNTPGCARSLYVHVPFCEAKCPYCAFASNVPRPGDAERYLAAAGREMSMRPGGARAFDTLYIGGGTPSVLPLRSWEILFGIIGKYYSFAPGAEMTVEANPSSLGENNAALWKDWGINRISIGVQSLNDERLAFLGRIHGSHQAAAAVGLCLGAGFSVSLDMMFGLPGEKLRDWTTDLRDAIRLKPHNISIYQLSVEQGTPFADRGFEMPEGYAQYRYAQWRLPRAGYGQYEIASFAAPGYESRHNANYWADGEYIGVGPSAWSYVNGVRFRNAAALDEYCELTLSGSPAVSSERMEGEKSARQSAVLALRTRRGIGWAEFAARYGDQIAKKIKDELRQFPGDLVHNGDGATNLTPKGFRVGNVIWSDII